MSEPASRSGEAVCTCGHERRDHCQEPPYTCCYPDCDCDDFTYPPKPGGPDKFSAIERLIACADDGIVSVSELISIKVAARAELKQIEEREAKWRKLLEAAFHGLRSYQYGNASTELAEEIADKIEAALAACAKMGG